MASIVHVPFNGQTIDAVPSDERSGYFVALRPLCENIGVDYSAQRKRLDRQPWSVVAMMTTTGSDGKSYEMYCIDRQTLVMWLATIDTSRLSSEAARSTLARYQRECAKALDAYFFRPAPQMDPASLLSDPKNLMTILVNWQRDRDRADMLQRENDALYPKALAADSFMECEGTYTVTEAARMLRQADGSMSRRRLFSLLRDDGLMERRGKQATARAVERGYLVNVATSFTAPDGRRVAREPYALVTPKGLSWMVGRYCSSQRRIPLALVEGVA